MGFATEVGGGARNVLDHEGGVMRDDRQHPIERLHEPIRTAFDLV